MINLFILDDDPVFHRLIELSLSRSSPFKGVYHYYEAQTLLNYIVTNKDDHSNLPDVILVDIKMPLLDGWGFMDALQRVHRMLSKSIWVYVVTVSVIKDDKIRAFSYPFVKDFIVKPIVTLQLTEIARSFQSV